MTSIKKILNKKTATGSKAFLAQTFIFTFLRKKTKPKTNPTNKPNPAPFYFMHKQGIYSQNFS